jgi:hypothetical protein
MRAVLNGGGSKALPFAKPRPAKRPPTAPGQASEAETQILEALRDKPLRHGELSRAIDQKASSISLRLRRLAGRGLVRRDDQGAWAATSSP